MISLLFFIFLVVLQGTYCYYPGKSYYFKGSFVREKFGSSPQIFAQKNTLPSSDPPSLAQKVELQQGLGDLDGYSDDYAVKPDSQSAEEEEVPIVKETIKFSAKDRLTSDSVQAISLRRSRVKRQQNKIDQALRDTTLGMLNFRPYLGEADAAETTEEDDDDDDDDDNDEDNESEREEDEINLSSNESDPKDGDQSKSELKKESEEMKKKFRLNNSQRFETIKSIHNTSTAEFFQWYIVKVSAGSEESVGNEINRRIREQDSLFAENVRETLVPKRRLPVLKRKNLLYAYTAYVPKQVYVKARLLPDVEYAICDIPGVFTVVQTRGSDVEQFIIEKKQLMERYEKDEEFRLSHPIMVGDAVEVLDEFGKPMGYGTFVGVHRSKCKVNIVNDLGTDEVLRYVEIEQVKYLEPDESDIAAQKIHEALTKKEDVMQLSAKDLLLKAMESAPNSRQLRYLLKNRQISSILNEADEKHQKPIANLSEDELSTLFQEPSKEPFKQERRWSSDRDEEVSPFSKRTDFNRLEDNSQRFKKRSEADDLFSVKEDDSFGSSRSYDTPRFTPSKFDRLKEDDEKKEEGSSSFFSSNTRPFSRNEPSRYQKNDRQPPASDKRSNYNYDSIINDNEEDFGVNSDDLDSIINSMISEDTSKESTNQQKKPTSPNSNSIPKMQSHFIRPGEKSKRNQDEIEDEFDFGNSLNDEGDDSDWQLEQFGKKVEKDEKSRKVEGIFGGGIDDVDSFDLDSIIRDFVENEKQEEFEIKPSMQASSSKASQRKKGRDPIQSDLQTKEEGNDNEYPAAINYGSFEEYLQAITKYEERKSTQDDRKQSNPPFVPSRSTRELERSPKTSEGKLKDERHQSSSRSVNNKKDNSPTQSNPSTVVPDVPPDSSRGKDQLVQSIRDSDGKPNPIDYSSFSDYLSALRRYEDQQAGRELLSQPSVTTTTPSPIKESQHSDGSYDKYTVKELKDLLRDKNLPISGTKAELIRRLTQI